MWIGFFKFPRDSLAIFTDKADERGCGLAFSNSQEFRLQFSGIRDFHGLVILPFGTRELMQNRIRRGCKAAT
eukprot:g18282.t1